MATLPNGLEAVAASDELVFVKPTPTLLQQVIADVKIGMPITQICQKKSDGSCPLSDCPCENNK
jgi:type VI secretion system secreted protein VgrG